MKKILIVWCMFFWGTTSFAAAPCGFKGISVGDRLSSEEIMKILNIKKFSSQSPDEDINDFALEKKHGFFAADEIRDEKHGAYCTRNRCSIHYGVFVGNNNTPVIVNIRLNDSLVTTITVAFSEGRWDELIPILEQKYEGTWSIDRTDMIVTDYETKKSYVVDRKTITHNDDGLNIRTGDKCKIMATNFDMVYWHHDSYGPFHSILIINLISKNF